MSGAYRSASWVIFSVSLVRVRVRFRVWVWVWVRVRVRVRVRGDLLGQPCAELHVGRTLEVMEQLVHLVRARDRGRGMSRARARAR